MHNNIRNNKFAYDWAIETIEYCNEHNIKLTIVTIGLDDTLKIKNISEIFKLAHKYNAINRINIYRKASDRNDECELSYDVLMEFLEWASKKQTVMDLMDPLFNSIAGGEDIVVDASGTNSYRIVSDGRIYPSTYLLTDDFLLGNINDKDFYFDNVTIKQFRDNILTPDYCKKCEFSNKCKGGAIDRRYLWYKTFNHPDPYCPKLHSNSKKYDIYYATHREKCESVHSNYLPTLFFKENISNTTN